jgi:CDP-6-deoxy-D-xylo-4-hexulose-3-dehydrase
MTDKNALRREILRLVDEYSRLDMQEKAGKTYRFGDAVPYATRNYDEAERHNLVDSALTFWLTADKYAARFETELAAYLGLPHAYAVNSGSAANQLAFWALTSHALGDAALRRGDEVITVAAGFPTTVAPVLQYGCVPVFVDVTIPGYNIDVSMLEAALSKRTRAVFIAHTLGFPFDVGAVRAFCDRNGLYLIEDNCDAIGAKYDDGDGWRMTGAFGDIGSSSFYPAHHITMGEGGAVYTRDKTLAKILLSMRDWGRDCVCPSGKDDSCGHRFDGAYGTLPIGYDHKYVYSHLGFNMKVTDMQAAIGCAQLEKLPSFVEARRRNWQTLTDGIRGAGLEEFLVLPQESANSIASPFGFVVTVREGSPLARADLVRSLEDDGIQTRMLFAGNLTRHPCFAHLEEGRDYRVIGGLPCTDRIMRDTFWVGVHPGLTSQQLEGMLRAFAKAYGKRDST